MPARLEASQIETLRVWGAGLAEEAREELRAAGKAITLLVEEIDRLNIDLWNARSPLPIPRVEEPEPASEPASAGQVAPATQTESLAATLRGRLRRRPSEATE